MTERTPALVVEDRRRMSLLGLLMEGLIRDNLSGSTARRIARRVRGDLRVQAGDMVATLRFDRERITILAGKRPGAKAWVEGRLSDMLDVLTLTHLVRPLGLRRVTLGGNLAWLTLVLPILIPRAAVEDRLLALVPDCIHRSVERRDT